MINVSNLNEHDFFNSRRTNLDYQSTGSEAVDIEMEEIEDEVNQSLVSKTNKKNLFEQAKDNKR